MTSSELTGVVPHLVCPIKGSHLDVMALLLDPMQLLLPLLFTLFVVAEVYGQTPSWKEKIEQFRGKLRDRVKERFGKLSAEEKTKLRKYFGGVDPDRRKARLERIGRKFNLTEEQRNHLHDRLSKLIHVNTTKPNEDVPVDLFEVNNKAGVSEYLYQGDVHLTEAQLSHEEEVIAHEQNPQEVRRLKRQATTVYPRWTGNTVYYYFDASVNARKQASVKAAHQYIQSRTCINFVQSSTAQNRIKVFNGAGCYSNVGMIGGEQTLSLGDGCEVIGTAAHEFTHALGVWHTQMRSDRDTYVTIDMSYVPASYQGNFDKLSASQNSITVPYEYGSMMHYGSNSFTTPNDKLSIVPKDMDYAYTMGNRQISFYDILMINNHYGCNAACPAATSAQCKNGGVPNPRNCATCNCPLGYEGALCDQRPAGCGETLTATSAWQSKQYSYGDMVDSSNVRDTFTLCNHWIQAPAGTTIQVQITSMYNPQCQYGCPFNGIEIKGHSSDPKITNPRYCCPEFNNRIFNSSLNPTPIISYNRYYYTSFTIQYRAIPSSGPVPAPATTKAPITQAPVTQAPSGRCKSMNTPTACAQNKAAGFCTSRAYSFQTIKYNCAVECGLCGKAANPCVDLNAQCSMIAAYGLCQSDDPMVMEYNCAKSCGFCTNPN